MAVRIKIESDNSGKPGFQDAARDLQALADRAGLTKAAKDLNKELDKRHWAEYRAQVRAAADELTGVAAANRKAKEEAAAAAEAQKKAADAEKSSNDSRQKSVQAVVDVYGMLKDAVGGVVSAVQAMAAEGNAAALDVTDAFEEVRQKLVKVGESRAVREMLHDAAAAARESGDIIANSAEYAAGRWKNAQLWIGYGMSAAVGAGNEFIEDQKRKLALIDQATADVAQKHVADEAKGAIKRLYEERGAALRQASLDDTKDFEALTRRYEAQLDQIAKIRDDSSLTIKERIDGIKREENVARELYARMRELEAEKRKQREESAKAEKQAATDSQAFQRQLIEMHLEGERAAQAEQKRTHDAKMKAMRDEAVAKAAKDKAEFDKLAGAGGDQAARQALASLDPRRIRAQYATQRMAETDANIRSGNFGEFSPGERARMLREARQEAFKAFNQGTANRGDVDQAARDLLMGRHQTVSMNQLRDQFIRNRTAGTRGEIDSGELGSMTSQQRARMIAAARREAGQQFDSGGADHGELAKAQMDAQKNLARGQGRMAQVAGNQIEVSEMLVQHVQQIDSTAQEFQQRLTTAEKQLRQIGTNNRYRGQRGP